MPIDASPNGIVTLFESADCLRCRFPAIPSEILYQWSQALLCGVGVLVSCLQLCQHRLFHVSYAVEPISIPNNTIKTTTANHSSPFTKKNTKPATPSPLSHVRQLRLSPTPGWFIVLVYECP